jgi:hypothetical protein
VHEILRRALKRHEEVMIVGIDNGAPAHQVWFDAHAPGLQPEPPALGVVAGRRERGVPDKGEKQRPAISGRNRGVTPKLSRDLVIAGARLTCREHRCQARCASANEQFPS